MMYHSDSNDKNISQMQHLFLFCYIINAVLMIHFKREARKRLEIRCISWKRLLPTDLKIQSLLCAGCNFVRFSDILILQIGEWRHCEVKHLVCGHTGSGIQSPILPT